MRMVSMVNRLMPLVASMPLHSPCAAKHDMWGRAQIPHCEQGLSNSMCCKGCLLVTIMLHLEDIFTIDGQQGILSCLPAWVVGVA